MKSKLKSNFVEIDVFRGNDLFEYAKVNRSKQSTFKMRVESC